MFHYATTDGHRMIICGRCGDMGPADFVLDECAFIDEHRQKHQEEA